MINWVTQLTQLKMGKDLTAIPPKWNTQMVNKHKKKCSASYSLRKCKSKLQ